MTFFQRTVVKHNNKYDLGPDKSGKTKYSLIFFLLLSKVILMFLDLHIKLYCIPISSTHF